MGETKEPTNIVMDKNNDWEKTSRDIRETKETLQREDPETGGSTGPPRGTPETGETKEPTNVVKDKNTNQGRALRRGG